ncbi:MAG TPA: hypothetical protein VEP72_06980, partial [Microbacterium sp.]|nr:hypothetical protein [Microbacterium sp.]
MNDVIAPPRRSPRALLALLLSFLLIAAGAVTAPAATAAPGPSVSAPVVARGGGTITVSGTGFVANSTGIYLGLGPAGLPGFYRGSSSLTDVVHVAVGNVSDATDAGRTEPMAEDGSFSVTITVPAFTEDAAYALYTSKA